MLLVFSLPELTNLQEEKLHLSSFPITRCFGCFEYDKGNSKIAKRCISIVKEKYGEQLDHELMSIENIQHMLSEQDIPIEIAKELAIIILRERFSVN